MPAPHRYCLKQDLREGQRHAKSLVGFIERRYQVAMATKEGKRYLREARRCARSFARMVKAGDNPIKKIWVSINGLVAIEQKPSSENLATQTDSEQSAERPRDHDSLLDMDPDLAPTPDQKALV